MSLRILIFICIITISSSLETVIEPLSTFCFKYMVVNYESNTNFYAVSYANQENELTFQLFKENEMIYEKKKITDFSYTINQTIPNDIYKMCIRNSGYTEKTVFFDAGEENRYKKMPLQKESLDNLEFFFNKVLIKLKKISSGIFMREENAEKHITQTDDNIRKAKYCSIAKILVVAIITVMEILVLMKFLEKKEGKKINYGAI